MNIATLIGFVVAFGAVIMTVLLEGGNPASLINTPAAVIVFGGTFGAALIGFPMDALSVLPKLIIKTIKADKYQPRAIIAQFVTLAEKARREGLLALEEDAQAVEDPFTKKGLLLVVDGTDAELVRVIMEAEVESMEQRHEKGFGLLEAMGGFAPTMGIIGTVMGLVNVLANMSTPDALAHSISTAFLATLYGIASANLLWLPLASKLKGMNGEEVFIRMITIEGILSVQAGDNPRLVKEKLEAFLSPKIRNAQDETPQSQAAESFEKGPVAAQ